VPTPSSLQERGRARLRAEMRDLALDAARTTTVARGWGAVRMGAVAAEIGTSRQSLHAEFGTKDDLGQALVARETGLLLAGIAARMDEHPGDLPAAVEAGARFGLEAVAVDPLLQAALAGGQARGATNHDTALLPLLTSRSAPLLGDGVELVAAWVHRHAPGLDPQVAPVLVESLVRLVVSHAVAPTSTPADAARALADLTRVVLGSAPRPD